MRSRVRDELQPAQARIFYQESLEVADGGTRQPALKEAENYAAQRR